MSKTAVSAAPKGTSFTHMRFFLDTEASGSGGGGEQGGEKRQEAGKGPQDGSRSLSRVLFKEAICMAWGSGYIMNGKVIGGESMALLGAIGAVSSLVTWRSSHGGGHGVHSEGGELWDQIDLGAHAGPPNSLSLSPLTQR